MIRACWKKERSNTLSNQAVDGSEIPLTALNHNDVVLEKQTKEVVNKDKRLVGNDQNYAVAEDPTYYEANNAYPVDDYDTTKTGQSKTGNSSKPVDIYNTFNEFQQQDDYDHLGDHKKPPRFTENEYNTTHGAFAQAIDDDTYNHLKKGPKTTAYTDNVYGMPRVEDDYDRMPPVGGTKATIFEAD